MLLNNSDSINRLQIVFFVDVIAKITRIRGFDKLIKNDINRDFTNVTFIDEGS